MSDEEKHHIKGIHDTGGEAGEYFKHLLLKTYPLLLITET